MGIQVYAIQSISHLRRIPQMIELLNSGDTEGSAVRNLQFQSSWDSMLDGEVGSDGLGSEADYEFNGNQFDADCTNMQED